jgi:hypothetical protein
MEEVVRMSKILRVDLSDYRPYIEALVDRLNEDGVYKMSMTDAVKISVEKAVEKILPDVIVDKTRKKYIEINF